MEEITKIADFQEYKKALTEELQKSAEGFIRIGYLLRMAMETDVLSGSGYANVYDFAQEEYGLDKSQVSRFMAINRKFSLGGYSDQIQPLFAGYGSSKLAVMLQLPDEIIKELSPEYSKAEITAIKDEVKAELSPEAPSDLEVMAEPSLPEYDSMTLWQQAIYKYLSVSPNLFMRLYIAAHGRAGMIGEELAPSGILTAFVRIEGKGKVSLFITPESKVSAYTIRSGETEDAPWADAEAFIRTMTGKEEDDPPACVMWSAAFHTPFPIEETPKEEKLGRVAVPEKELERDAAKTQQKPKEPVQKAAKPAKPAMPKPEVLPPEQVEEIRPEIAPEQPEQMDISDVLAPEDLPGDYVHDKEIVNFDRRPGIWKEISQWVDAMVLEFGIELDRRQPGQIKAAAEHIIKLCGQLEEE